MMTAAKTTRGIRRHINKRTLREGPGRKSLLGNAETEKLKKEECEVGSFAPRKRSSKQRGEGKGGETVPKKVRKEII